MNDLRYALRQLTKHPGFTLGAALTLAIGIGGNTAIFAMLDRLFLRPLPVEAPERLVRVVTDRGEDGVNANLSYPAFTALREETAAFAGALASTLLPLGWSASDGTTRIAGAAVSGEYFAVLGLRPAAGRWFAPDEAVVGRPEPVAVVSHGFWTRSLGTEPGVVGREIRLNDRPFTIIGVAPPGFEGLVRGSSVDVWIPLPATGLVSGLGNYLAVPDVSWLNVFARLALGVSRDAAQAALAVGDAARIAAGTQFEGERRRLWEGSAGLTSRVGVVEKPLAILMAAVALLLLIACGNVAALLLVRARERRREVAVRLALGADRSRLVRQFLTESLLLAGLGCGLGLLVADWSASVLAGYRMAGGQALVVATGLDARVVGFAALVSLATVLLFGLVPALGASRPAVVPALKGATGQRRGGRWLIDPRDGLVMGQAALAVVLVVGASLLGRTVRNLERVDVGFDASDVLIANLDLEARRFDREGYAGFYDALLERLRGLPGVEGATAATTVWPNPGGENWDGVRLEGFAGSSDDVSFDVNRVGPDYFETLGIPVLRGRGFDSRDRGPVSVAVVNQTMARRYWPGEGAVGRRIVLGSESAPLSLEVVGVVQDGKYRGLREAPRATAYLSLLQAPRPFSTVLMRTAGDPLSLAGALRREVMAVASGVPVFDVRSLETHVRFASSGERLAANLVGLFGLVSLGLAALGLYGVLAAAVGQRTREIGLRMALGAGAADVMRLFLGRAALLVAAGAVLGTAVALAATRVVRDLLFGVGPTDPASFLAAAGALAMAGVIASFLPAWRAARLEPMQVLRHE